MEAHTPLKAIQYLSIIKYISKCKYKINRYDYKNKNMTNTLELLNIYLN